MPFLYWWYMKYLLLLSLLCLVSCSESDEHAKARQKEEEMLSHAEKKQEEQPASEAETVPAEPQCYEVNYDEIYQGNVLIATCETDETKIEACGVVGNSCLDGVAVACLKEVKIKFIKKEVCDKKE